MPLYPFKKYQATGNDFILIDNRDLSFPTDNQTIEKLCNRHFGIGADGLMLLQNKEGYDFEMVYFNSDGNISTMCGNGGRSIVAFARDLGIIETQTKFWAIDGEHLAGISASEVELKMIDVTQIQERENKDYFLNTGSPHHVQFVTNIQAFDVYNKGKEIRNGSPYFKEGANVNFVEKLPDETFWVRTYERGVENETLSCGTGVTAAAIASYKAGHTKKSQVRIQTLGGNLQINFIESSPNHFENIYLMGPAQFVFEGKIEI
ncbi:MAG: diaminopimelate epimerase [Flavobacteriaceae bacterium]|nr:MAG: diaminopimelate epimerase [Flavobacteriaceae bacterium]